MEPRGSIFPPTLQTVPYCKIHVSVTTLGSRYKWRVGRGHRCLFTPYGLNVYCIGLSFQGSELRTTLFVADRWLFSAASSVCPGWHRQTYFPSFKQSIFSANNTNIFSWLSCVVFVQWLSGVQVRSIHSLLCLYSVENIALFVVFAGTANHMQLYW